MKLVTKAGMIVAAVAGVLALTAGPAAAENYDELTQGYDVGGVTARDNGSYRIDVWDFECDYHKVVVEWVNYGSSTVHTLADPDGCFGDGGARTQDSRVSSWRLCERGQTCTGWVSGPRP